MAKCCNLHELKPALLMVLVQTVYSLVNLCYKLAANDGMNLSILVGYRFLFGAAFILPVAFFAERKKRPKLTKKIALYGFLCGLFGGSLGQNLYLKGLVLTSATFVSAMTNLIPAITFIVAISLRLERLAWNTAAGKAKVFGTMLGIGGAMILTFYKGLELDPWNTDINLLETTATHRHHLGLEPQNGRKYVVGAVLALASCLCYSLWLIVQAKAAQEYPCPYSITAIMAVAASVQCIAFALCGEREWSQWNLGWDIRLLTVAVSGILGTGLMFTLVAWCVRTRGPLFVSIFQPLMLLMVAVGGSLFLEEKLHLGMLIGAIFIVSGLYIVLWGKRQEIKASQSTGNPENEARIDIPPPPPPPVQGGSSNRSSRADVEVEVDVEEESHRDMPSSQNGNSHSNSGRMLESEAEGPTDLPLPQPNSNIRSRSCRGVEEQTVVESQNGSSHSCSSSRVEVQGRIDLPSPLQTQNENSSSSSSGSLIEEVEEQLKVQDLQNGSSGSMKEAEVEVQGGIHLPSPLQTQNNNSSSSSGSGAEVEEQMKVEAEVEVEVEAETRKSMSSHSQNGSSSSCRSSSCDKRKEVEVDEREEEKRDYQASS